MDERRYRGSRICRALGNPIVYAIITLLSRQGPTTPSDIARTVGRRIQTVSGHLAALRGLDLVRYDRAQGQTRYWLKHPRKTQQLLRALAQLVGEAAQLHR